MAEYKSFYKTVAGNEGQKCHYPTRLDTYGCGCAHDCDYCYAKSLLSFRDLWNPQQPAVADIKKIEAKIKTLKKGTVLRLGGMTDCFQPCERILKNTYNTIKLLNKYGIHYLIVTKSDLVADDEYVAIMNKRLAHIQITVTSTDDNLSASYEHATPPSERIKAIEKLNDLGFDVQIRLSPLIPDFLDFDIINSIRCEKAIVEFLRINSFIRKTFTNIDYSKYTHKEGGYLHLELEEKIRIIRQISGFKEISVCEDCTEAYDYWKEHVNYNKNDCCNLRLKQNWKHIGNNDAIGDRALMSKCKTAFLCSSTISDETIGISVAWACDQARRGRCIVSGFQSKAERAVLDAIVENKGYAIVVLACAMFNKCPKKYKEAVDSGHMLIISGVDNDQYKVTRASAEIRNRFVIDMADNIVIGCIKRNGMTEKLIAQTDKPCFVLESVRKE